MREIQRKGRAKEEYFKSHATFAGYNVKGIGGHDFVVERTDIFSGKKERKFVEVKGPRARLSKLQKKTKKLKEKYAVYRPQY